MGSGITVRCQSCSYEDAFTLGIGMMYSSLENVISLVSPRRRDTVRELLARHDVEDVSYEHRMFICPSCSSLASRFDFSITYNNGQVYAPYFRCSKCKEILTPLEEPIEHVPCSICGKRTLEQAEMLLWD